MKKLLICAAALLLSAACSDDPAPAPQKATCRITAPVEGAEVDLTQPLTIRGEGSVDDGRIASVRLTVGGEPIAEVTTVPFVYEHAFPADAEAGDMKIVLEVAGDRDGKASAETTVRLVRPEQHVTCSLTSPAEGERIDLTNSLLIKGEGSVDIGAISKVELKVGDRVIDEVTSVPFTYEHAFAADQAAGEVLVTLVVEGDRDGRATDEKAVTLFAPEQHATCALTEPAEGAEVSASEPLTIRGEGSVDYGTITEVELKVGGELVAAVTEVPFTYAHRFAEGQAAGELKIELRIEGDREGTASVVRTVNVKVAGPDPGQNEMVDARDGRIYRTVTIGGQTWLAENLAYLPQVNNADESSRNDGSEGQPFYYVFGYNGNDVAAAKATDAYKSYGVLYNWFAAMNEPNAAGADETASPSGVRGVCPEGWHLPSKAEWQELEAFVAAQLPAVEGNGWYNDFDGVWVFDNDCKNVWAALTKIDGGWGSSNGVQENPDLADGPRDTYGLGVMPAGGYYPNGASLEQKFTFYDANTSFWLTHKQTYGGGIITFSNLNYHLDYSRFGNQSERGVSVRCVKD